MARLDGESYLLIGTVDSSDARVVLLQEVLARLGDLKKAITKAQHEHNARDLAKECRKLLAAPICRAGGCTRERGGTDEGNARRAQGPPGLAHLICDPTCRCRMALENSETVAE